MKAVQRMKAINQGNELKYELNIIQKYLLNNDNNSNILVDSVGGMEVSLNLEVLCNTNTTHARC